MALTSNRKRERRAEKQATRRNRQDASRQRAKAARAVERDATRQNLSDDQRREQMERIKMSRVEQYVGAGMLRGV